MQLTMTSGGIGVGGTGMTLLLAWSIMTSSDANPRPKKIINVVGAVLTNGDKILAARRGQSMSLPGMWEFPGGKIEPNETPQDALRRELEEELMCTAEVGAHLETTQYEYDFGIVILSTYFCQLLKGEPQLTEHSEITWLPVQELGSLDWAPADIPAVERLMRDRPK